MNLDLLLSNLTNPALLFFCLGLFAVRVKSDLRIPENSSKFISLYLLLAIGFKGGQELAHSEFTSSIGWIIGLAITSALVIPVYSFALLKRKFGNFNAAAIAAAYGSVSAVTFVTAVSFLELQNIEFGGHMVAVMALMEAPAIIVGVVLLSFFQKNESSSFSLKEIISHALTNGGVFLILGSLLIGYLASAEQAEGIRPFTTDIFKGFLAVFLLDMGITSGSKLKVFRKLGLAPILYSVIVPLFNGLIMAWISGFATSNVGDRLLISVLAASASYIAVPAAMKMANPKANSGLYLPMALGITFPMNITVGLPLYFLIINCI
ncbi:sodium-dependent bicarbonate transport family permease [Luteibaculum oceani]|uniref:Sodium-dependent bicarbonate transport family permease n=1 Tax=Luteibaculum oceani TaxID=1294296 RepID=A0A5C6UYY4_9FLAO|nr:sodium-dependent bicarbonate transport family permease [Luteibaculum oceani]TXC78693.1 sodium-dependent bicarbonate transport family permease [Luteibaculum oceani]